MSSRMFNELVTAPEIQGDPLLSVSVWFLLAFELIVYLENVGICKGLNRGQFFSTLTRHALILFTDLTKQ